MVLFALTTAQITNQYVFNICIMYNSILCIITGAYGDVIHKIKFIFGMVTKECASELTKTKLPFYRFEFQTKKEK